MAEEGASELAIPVNASDRRSTISRQVSKTESHPGSYASSTINLTNTLIGTGMLSLPKAFAAGGIVLGFFTISWCALTSAFGLYFLSKSAEKVSPGGKFGQVSFTLLSQKSVPKIGRLLDLAVSLKCFGVAVSYLIIIGSLVPKVLLVFVNGDASQLPAWSLDRHLYITLAMIVLTPFAFLKSLKSLTVISTIALCAVADFVFLVVFKYFYPPSDLPPEYPGDLRLVEFSWNFVKLFPVQVFAFTCAQNLLSVYNEFDNVTSKKMTKTIATSIGIASIVYVIVGIFGYLTFGSHVVGNILEMYPNSTGVSICQLGIVILVTFSYPLQIHPCRTSLEKVIHPPQPLTIPALNPSNDVSDETDVGPGHDTELTYVTVGLLFSTYLVAMFVSKLDVVLGFVGATGSTTISFIIPSVFYIVLYKDTAETARDKNLITCAKGLFVWGIFVTVVSLTLQILSLLG